MCRKCQQDELHAAEARGPKGSTFTSIEEIQRFVDGLRDTWWWQLWYPRVRRVEVYHRTTHRFASVGWYEKDKEAGAIDMLDVHWNQLYVLHELAHVLAEARYGSHAHDPWFASVYLGLVSVVLGPGIYTPLYNNFVDAGIQFDFERDEDEPLGAIPLGPAG